MGTRSKAWETAVLPVAKVRLWLEDYLAAKSKLTGISRTGRSKDNLYEPQLAESEREAVSDLLAYLENVRRSQQGYGLPRYANIVKERRDGLFYRGPASIIEYSGVFREHRTPTKRELNVCRDYGAR